MSINNVIVAWHIIQHKIGILLLVSEMISAQKMPVAAGAYINEQDGQEADHLFSDRTAQAAHPEILQLTAEQRASPRILILLVLGVLSLFYFTNNECKLESVDRAVRISKQRQWSSSSFSNSFAETSLRPVDWGWCPEASCLPSPMCHPCQRRFLIVITNGRSASTTLTWMLNLLPGLRMGGENNNALQNIMTMMEATTAGPYEMQPGQDEEYSAWYHNPVPDGALSCVSQKMIETIVPPTWINATHIDPYEADEIIGFKTIRLLRDNDIQDVPKIAEFLKAHFPCAKYLINYRSDFAQQAKSQVSSLISYQEERANITAAISRISNEVKRLKKMAALLGNRAMVIDSAKWTEDVEELNKAVKWLGFDTTCAFPNLMELNTGRSTANKNDEGAPPAPSPNNRKLGSWSPLKRNRIGPKAEGAYHHGTTNVELDPSCRYVGNYR